MKKAVRNIILILIGILIAGVIAVSYIAGRESRKPLVCKGLDVVVLDSLENDFVSAADVRKFLDREYGQYLGQPLEKRSLCHKRRSSAHQGKPEKACREIPEKRRRILCRC